MFHKKSLCFFFNVTAVLLVTGDNLEGMSFYLPAEANVLINVTYLDIGHTEPILKPATVRPIIK